MTATAIVPLTFKAVQPTKGALAPTAREFVDLGQAVERALNPVLRRQILNGHLLQGVELEPFVDNEISHGLGRPLLGYEVVRREAVLADFRAQLSSAQAVTTAGSGELMELAQEDFDSGGCWDSSAYRFTAPVAGLYEFSIGAHLQALTAGVVMQVWLQKNGSSSLVYGTQLVPAVGGSTVAVSGSARLRLAVNDYIEGWVYHTHGSNRNLQDTTMTFLAGGLVDEGITDRQRTLSAADQARKLVLRCSYAQTISLWVF